MARRLVGLLIPAGRIIPLRGVGLGTRIRPLGRSIPSHCLSVPALRLIAAKGALFDRYRALLCRHRCQSSINTVTRGRAQGLIGRSHRRADGGSVEFLVTILPGHQTCPAAGANPTVRGETRNTLMVDLRKATKGRRMSKKTRKKSSKPAPKSRKTPARKPAAAKTPQQGRPPQRKPSAKKPAAKAAGKAAKTAAKAAVAKPDKPAKTTSAKASHKPPSKPLKSNLSAPPKPAAGSPHWSRARQLPPSVCRATAATASRWPIMRARNWCCSSIPAPTPPAAPGKRSTSRDSRARLPTRAPRCSASRQTP